MDENYAIERLVQEVKKYAEGRTNGVARGTETPRLAALLLQKYGLGIVEAVATIYDDRRVADPIYKVLDEETSKIDPQWREHMRERWEGRPADVVFYSDETIEK